MENNNRKQYKNIGVAEYVGKIRRRTKKKRTKRDKEERVQ